MLKNTGRSRSNIEKSTNGDTHFSYDAYRKKVKRNSYKDLTIFISVLVIGVLIFLGFAKILSPNVDVEIADNNEYSQLEDETVQGTIDERLRHLQAEDEANAQLNHDEQVESLFTPELDEAVVLPKSKKTIGEIEEEMKNNKSQKETVEQPEENKSTAKDNKAPVASKPEQKTSAPAPLPLSYKVVVGSYATDKQAEVAKSIMQDAGLGVTPIVKHLGGSYTLQIGVFSSKEKAQQSVNNLLKNNFPARIVE